MATLALTDPVNGTTADATLIANNNAAIKTIINGGLQNDNIASGAAISASKLSGYPADATKVLLGDGTWGNVSTTLTLDQITTSTAAISATTEATAVTVISGSTASFTGSRVWVEFFVPGHTPATTDTMLISFVLMYDTTSVATVRYRSGSSGIAQSKVEFALPHTPSAGVHSYAVKAYVPSGSVTFNADAGGVGKLSPGYLRVKRD